MRDARDFHACLPTYVHLTRFKKNVRVRNAKDPDRRKLMVVLAFDRSIDRSRLIKDTRHIEIKRGVSDDALKIATMPQALHLRL